MSTRISIQACVRLNSLVIIDVVVIVLVVVVGFTMRVCCSLDEQEYISWGSDRFSLTVTVTDRGSRSSSSDFPLLRP